jgi:hypothetical protein
MVRVFNSPCVTGPLQLDDVTNVRGGGGGAVMLAFRKILGPDLSQLKLALTGRNTQA